MNEIVEELKYLELYKLAEAWHLATFKLQLVHQDSKEETE